MRKILKKKGGVRPGLAFLLILCAMGAPGALVAQPAATDGAGGQVLLQSCGCSLPLPEGFTVTARNDRLVVARSLERAGGQRIPVTLRFLCAPNARRTSMISEIRRTAREKNMNVRSFATFELSPGLEAAVYFKSRIFQGRVIQNTEGYFATRTEEYFFYLIPETGGAPLPAGLRSRLLDRTRATLAGIHFFVPIEITITEANYRLRYRALLALVGLAVLLIVGWALRSWNVKRRRSREHERKRGAENEGDEIAPEPRATNADGESDDSTT